MWKFKTPKPLLIVSSFLLWLLLLLFRYPARIFWGGQVDRQGELLFQVAGMLWQVTLLSLHDHARLMQALVHSVEPQVLREAHRLILQNHSVPLRLGIHLTRRTTSLPSKVLKVLISMAMRGLSTSSTEKTILLLRVLCINYNLKISTAFPVEFWITGDVTRRM
uniref:Uncharacterized protein n=1 Tax=Aegilops tauschii subsp. strangulata TaxID=200361 RepID=A0A453F939_AEGTS